MPSFEDAMRAMTAWDARVASQYALAYNDAYQSYTEAKKKDEEDAKARAELFVSIASLMSCSILVAAVVSRPLQQMALGMAARRLGEVNTSTVVSLFTKAAAQPAISFAFGEAVDMTKDQAEKALTGIASQTAANVASGVTAIHPYSRGTQMTAIIKNMALGIDAMARAIKGQKEQSISRREERLHDLARSPFMRMPEKTIDSGKLTAYIELGFFLQHLLDSDYIMRHAPIGTRMPASRAGGINAMPLSKEYPKSEPATAMRFYNTVHSDRPGNAIQDGLDAAHKKVFGKPFFERSMLPEFVRTDAGRADELVRAELTLRELSKQTRPTRADEVKIFSF